MLLKNEADVANYYPVRLKQYQNLIQVMKERCADLSASRTELEKVPAAWDERTTSYGDDEQRHDR